MSQLTISQIRRIMPNAPLAKVKAAIYILNAVALHYKITTAQRLRFWLATLAVESGELKYNSELGVHPEYEFRKDLGNIYKGDGVAFEGHGRIQITGRDAHTAYTRYLKKSGHLPFVDFVKYPARLAEEPYATDAAGWFVNGYKNLNPLADANNFLAYQVKVNGRNRKTGKPNHWKERQEYYRRAVIAIPDDFVLTAESVTPIDVEKIEPKRLATQEGYPDFEIPATAAAPNTVTPNGEDFDDISDLPPANGLGEAKPSSEDKNATQSNTGANSGTTTPDAELKKERPSTFMRWITAIKVAVGAFLVSVSTFCGGSELHTQIANKAVEKAEPNWLPIIGVIVLITALGIGAGVLLMWVASKFYDKSAERSNRLNQEKIKTAADKDKNTVELKIE